MLQSLAEWEVTAGTRVGIVGLGGLGHMGVKFSKLMGAYVMVLIRAASKASVAHELGADDFILSVDESSMESAKETLDLMLSTASGVTVLDSLMQLLRTEGTLVCAGLLYAPLSVSAFQLTRRRRRIAGVSHGSIELTPEVLNLCGKHGVGSTVEVVHTAHVNEAWDRVELGDARFRVVLGTASLRHAA